MIWAPVGENSYRSESLKGSRFSMSQPKTVAVSMKIVVFVKFRNIGVGPEMEICLKPRSVIILKTGSYFGRNVSSR
jgi:hypothetical protein